MGVDDFESFLSQRGVKFTKAEIDHATQIRAASGEIVNVFHSGKVTVQGKKTPLRQELESLNQTGFLPAESETPTTPPPGGPLNKRVFVVYGHDVAAREKLELILLKMGLEPIVLANLPATGDTIIEKLEKYLRESHNVGFACVLLTPDDEGNRAGAPEEKKYRARQNVILELGMVLSRLSRKRVAILYKESVERPSDIDGLLYLPYKESLDEIKSSLFKELKAGGYSPDPAGL